jgi:hypothetical protein
MGEDAVSKTVFYGMEISICSLLEVTNSFYFAYRHYMGAEARI